MNEVTPAPARGRALQESPLGWLRTEIDRLFDDFGRPARSIFNFGSLAPVPALELTEKDKEYRLTAELPGIKEDDVEIGITDGILTLTGEKREESEHDQDGALLSERRYGVFERSVTLPAGVKADAITAEFHKGVLTIVLPKDETVAKRTRKIAIKSKN